MTKNLENYQNYYTHGSKNEIVCPHGEKTLIFLKYLNLHLAEK